MSGLVDRRAAARGASALDDVYGSDTAERTGSHTDGSRSIVELAEEELVDTPKKSLWTTEVLGQTRRARGGARGRATVRRSGSRRRLGFRPGDRQQSGRVAWAPAKGEGEESSRSGGGGAHGHQRLQRRRRAILAA